MIYISTKAYNAEKTIRQTIESVLSQSYGDFTYYVCDNGSDDGTRSIIQEYSRIDSRVILVKQPTNILSYSEKCSSDMKRFFYELMYSIRDDDWYSFLDADDDLNSDFLKELVAFANQESLDYVACRSEFIKEPEKSICSEYVLKDDIVIRNTEDFGSLFPCYFRFIGAGWGKLQKGSLFKKFSKNEADKWVLDKQLVCRRDTATQLFYLLYSQKAGVKAKPLHNYHLYPKGKSVSTQFLDEKIKDNYKMPDIYREYLNRKVGYVSDENEQFIKEVYERSMRRTYEEIGVK